MEQPRSLWEAIISFQNMHSAFKKTARGKRSKHEIAAFEMNLEEQLFILMEELESGQYRPGLYNQFAIHSPKRRLISAAPFRDRVVHHALCNFLEPIFESKFIFDSYANRKGKGNHHALDRCTKFMRKFKYVLPLDIQKFFPSINHKILYEVLEKDIHCKRTLTLCKTIIENGAEKEGLPIGNLTSQFWANVYLNPLDHFIKRVLKCKGFLRYVDDMLLFSDDKKLLGEWKNEIIYFLNDIQLRLHENSAQARPCSIALPFLGFQVYPDHRRLKSRKVIHARRHMKKLVYDYHAGIIPFKLLDASIKSWVSHAAYGDTWGLRKNLFSSIIF